MTYRMPNWRILLVMTGFSGCSEPSSFESEPDSYTVTLVCESCGQMRATDMNEAGDVAGSELVGGSWVGRLWTGDDVIDLGSFIPALINDDLDAAGSTPDGGAVWSAEGGVRSLPGTPTGIDAEGRVAIRSPHQIWIDGALIPIAEWSNFSGAILDVGRMNRMGEIAGSAVNASYWRPLLLREGSTTPLDIGGGRYGSAIAVNDNRDVIGTAEVAPMQGAAAYFVTEAGQQHRLPFDPRDLNNARHVVGDSANVAMLWQDGKTVALTTKVRGTGYVVTKAVAITDAGEILAQVADGRFVRLRPIPTP